MTSGLKTVAALASLLAPLLQAADAERVGAKLAPWKPGQLDIHQISTGRGNAAFMILPDGTTLLVDAGNYTREVPDAAPRPDGAHPPGEWIARYIRHMLAARREPAIDYALITYFDPDHMGLTREGDPLSSDGDYRLCGITRVAESLPIRTLVDRAWPDYDFPRPLDSPMMMNYRRFIESQSHAGRLRVERFRVGRNDQFRLLHDPAAYPQFEIRNVASNGEVWTGVGESTRQHFPALETIPSMFRPTENLSSNAIRIRYGAFDYYTGGDLHGVPDPGEPPWHNMEIPVGKAVGPVDVHVVNHHGSIDPASPFFLDALRPRVHIIPSWRPSHPAPVVLKRIMTPSAYPGERDVFTVALRQSTRTVIGPRADRIRNANGHVVVRVDPGGETYRVVCLDDTRESYEIISVHGPYASR